MKVHALLGPQVTHKQITELWIFCPTTHSHPELIWRWKMKKTEWTKWLKNVFLTCFPPPCLTGWMTVLITFSKHLSQTIKPWWIKECHQHLLCLISWAVLSVYGEGNTYAYTLYLSVSFTLALCTHLFGLPHQSSPKNKVRNVAGYWLNHFPIGN